MLTLKEGNNNLIADTLSVYTDGDTDGYVASNSLPSYPITDIVEETLIGGTAAGLDEFPF